MAMSDKRFFKLAAERDRFHKMSKEGEIEKKKLDQLLIPELDRRKIRSVSGLGLKVTKTAQSYTQYSVERAKQILKPKVYRSIVTEVIDPSALAQALSDGTITDKQAAKFTERLKKAPYITVTPDDASAPTDDD